MKLSIYNGYLIVEREDEDKKYYGTKNAAGESNFLHDLKNKLNSMGFDLIKKRMWKDGHLVDEFQQYLRTRSKSSKTPHIYLHNPSFALAGLNDWWNDEDIKQVKLDITFDVYEAQPDCEEMMKKLLDVSK